VLLSVLLLAFAFATRNDLEGLAGAVVGYIAGYWLPAHPRDPSAAVSAEG
jgi:hypothetical protein